MEAAPMIAMAAAQAAGTGYAISQGSKKTEFPTVAPPIDVNQRAVQQASTEAMQRRNKSAGYRSTILSDLSGSGGAAPRSTIGS